MLPALEIIDGFNRSGDEVESDDEEEDEEEEEEEEEESSSDDEPGLSYLQKTINSVSHQYSSCIISLGTCTISRLR